jgi:PhnB protein
MHETSATPATRPIPEGYYSLTPGLVVRDAAKAIEFYQRAFGAQEVTRMQAPDGRVWHAELQIGDSRLMLGDEFPDMGTTRAPQSLGGTSVSVHLYVEDVDAVFKRAVEAGATVTEPLTDMFWGDRYGKITDPFGHDWGLATRVEEVSEEEQQRRAEAFARQSS